MPSIRKRTSEQRIDERREGGSGREHDEAAENQGHQNYGQQPVLLAHFEEMPEFDQKAHRLRSELTPHRALLRTELFSGDPVARSVRLVLQAQQISSHEAQQGTRGKK